MGAMRRIFSRRDSDDYAAYAARHGHEWRVDRLAVYNAERARGIVHTPEWESFMADEQAAYERWISGNGTFEWEGK